jgi:hypothetical protein
MSLSHRHKGILGSNLGPATTQVSLPRHRKAYIAIISTTLDMITANSTAKREIR